MLNILIGTAIGVLAFLVVAVIAYKLGYGRGEMDMIRHEWRDLQGIRKALGGSK